jgi:hypothetical protein
MVIRKIIFGCIMTNFLYFGCSSSGKWPKPYDKTGGTGRKTLLSQEDLEKVVFEGSMNDMLY